jgi:hypothetical protein
MKDAVFEKVIYSLDDCESHIKISVNVNCLAITGGEFNITIEKDNNGVYYFSIEGVDTAYWNSEEYENIEYLILAMISAIKGHTKNRKSLFGKNEICFDIGSGKWLCTRLNTTSRFHYTKIRKLGN